MPPAVSVSSDVIADVEMIDERTPTGPGPRPGRLVVMSATAAAILIAGAIALAANLGPVHPPAANSGAHTAVTTRPPIEKGPSRSAAPSPSLTPTAMITPTAAPATSAAAVSVTDLPGASSGTIAAMSCTAQGDCTAVGTYPESGTQSDAMFASTEVNGTWSASKQLAGSIEGQQITVDALSCASPGNCVAGGSYDPSYNDGVTDPFVVEEKAGTWQAARPLSLPAADGTSDAVTSVDCPSAGNCTAAGAGDTSAGAVFTADEVNGAWRTTRVQSGFDLSGTYFSGQAYVSCAIAGNCVLAAGTDVAAETGGTWGAPTSITGAPAEVTALSCAPDGECAGGGGDNNDQPWVASEVDGTWAAASTVRGIIAIDGGGTGQVNGLVCQDGGNCDLVGGAATPEGNSVAFSDQSVSHTWGSAQDQSGGMDPYGTTEVGAITALSCPSFGTCGALANDDTFRLFESHGTWSLAPGSRLDAAISCPTSAWCAVATADDSGQPEVTSGQPTALASPVPTG